MGPSTARQEIRRDAKSIYNRLRSIQADAAFVSEIADMFPQFPVLANERCGNWYVHPSKIHKPGVYFKSTDGHTGVWDFNLRRYNAHLLTIIMKHGGCIIVDSTRKGKRIPDALSKTIPIWCATINSAVQKCARQNQAKVEAQEEAERKEQRETRAKAKHERNRSLESQRSGKSHTSGTSTISSNTSGSGRDGVSALDGHGSKGEQLYFQNQNEWQHRRGSFASSVSTVSEGEKVFPDEAHEKQGEDYDNDESDENHDDNDEDEDEDDKEDDDEDDDEGDDEGDDDGEESDDTSKHRHYTHPNYKHIPSLDESFWDTRFHSLPSAVSRSEHAQIFQKVHGFADKLMRFTDLSLLTLRLQKPIRPIWITPQSFLIKENLPDYSKVGFLPIICLSASSVVPEGLEQREGYLYVQGSGDDEEMWAKGLTPELFWTHEKEILEPGGKGENSGRDGGDDDDRDDDDLVLGCEERVREIVRKARQDQLERSLHNKEQKQQRIVNRNNRDVPGNNDTLVSPTTQPMFTPSMELCSQIKPYSIWIGNNQSGRPPQCWHAGFRLVINCGAEIMRDRAMEYGGEHVVLLDGGATLYTTRTDQFGHPPQHHHQFHHSDQSQGQAMHKQTGGKGDLKEDDTVYPEKSYFYLHLPIAEGKKGQYKLLEMLPVAISTTRGILEKERLEHHEQCQKDQAVVECGSAPAPFNILVHCQQGMDRSVGVTLALLVACFDCLDPYSTTNTSSPSSPFFSSCSFPSLKSTSTSTSVCTTPANINKELIQKKLFEIMSHRLAARPSRATLKMVNTHFMSPASHVKARYLQNT